MNDEELNWRIERSELELEELSMKNKRIADIQFQIILKFKNKRTCKILHMKNKDGYWVRQCRSRTRKDKIRLKEWKKIFQCTLKYTFLQYAYMCVCISAINYKIVSHSSTSNRFTHKAQKLKAHLISEAAGGWHWASLLDTVSHQNKCVHVPK